ncbi:hypothetical protein KI387_014297, partial [Taxus chinensis]
MKDDSITEEVKSENKEETSATVPEAEVHLYVKGQGPINVFKCPLGGWDQDKLDLIQIMDDYGLKTLYAFSTRSGRGAPLRFNHRNGLSMLAYTGKQVCIDGDPKDSLLKPITKILLVFALVTFLIAIAIREKPPQWVHNIQVLGGGSLAWTIAIVVFVYSRLRKKLQNVLK